MAAVVEEMSADSDWSSAEALQVLRSPACRAIMGTHLGGRTGAFVITWSLNQNNVNVIGVVAGNVAIDGFARGHIGIVSFLNDGHIADVFTFAHVLEHFAVRNTLLQIGGSGFILQVYEVLMSDHLRRVCCGTEVVLGFAFSLFGWIGASTLHAALAIDGRYRSAFEWQRADRHESACNQLVRLIGRRRCSSVDSLHGQRQCQWRERCNVARKGAIRL